MKRNARKLNLRVETVRNLSKDDLDRVAGGMSSVTMGKCSTEQHVTHCACETYSCDVCGF
jgi:hypothetical protein